MECENKDCVRVRMQRDSLHTHFWNSNLSMKCKDATIARLKAENKRLRARSKVLAGALLMRHDVRRGLSECIACCRAPHSVSVANAIRLADAEVRKMGVKRGKR